MYDMPEHWLIPVTEDGQGPALDDDVHHFVCACGNDDSCPGLPPPTLEDPHPPEAA
jgi:hypothetical protein